MVKTRQKKLYILPKTPKTNAKGTRKTELMQVHHFLQQEELEDSPPSSENAIKNAIIAIKMQ